MEISIDDIKKYYREKDKCFNPYLRSVVGYIEDAIDEFKLRANGNDDTKVNAWYVIFRLEDLLQTCFFQDDVYIQDKKESLDRIKNIDLKPLKPVHVPDLQPLEHLKDGEVPTFIEFDDSLLDELPPVTNEPKAE